jgi:acetoin utilization protein AcuC
MATRKVFVHDTRLDRDGYPPMSPFKTTRAGRTREIALSMGLLAGRERSEVAPTVATREELERFHAPHYLDLLERCARGDIPPEAGEVGLGTPDCPIFAHMYEYPALAAGATLTAARQILNGSAHVAFNPSGGYHHAGPRTAAGFCYLNDVVLACQEFAAAGRRTLFLDLDVHHCDGVQDAFYDRPDVMTLSLHESGRTLFPGTGFEEEIGEGAGRGYSVNVPLPVGTHDEAYVRVFHDIALPLIGAYNPDVIVLELGMDALAGDPLAHLNLTNNAYADVVESVVRVGKPILATGGGGYNPENTARGWALLWGVLTGEDTGHDLTFGLGGVMLGTTEWLGGLRDRVLISDGGRRADVDAAIAATAEKIKRLVFPLHGL